jgi:hypothetical protein
MEFSSFLRSRQWEEHRETTKRIGTLEEVENVKSRNHKSIDDAFRNDAEYFTRPDGSKKDDQSSTREARSGPCACAHPKAHHHSKARNDAKAHHHSEAHHHPKAHDDAEAHHHSEAHHHPKPHDDAKAHDYTKD